MQKQPIHRIENVFAGRVQIEVRAHGPCILADAFNDETGII